jgi:AraC-like DNA-binding protein
LELAASVVQAAGQLPAEFRRASARDERRIAAAVRLIESTAHDLESDRLRVGQLARDANLTPYHFLRTFRRVVGMTPHQYVIRTRLQRAAVRLCVSAEPVSRIAYACGFNDLSTFNHQFRRALGESPSAYRVLRRRQFESPATATRRLGSSL